MEIHIIQNRWEQEKQQKPKQKKSDIKFREKQVTHERELVVRKTHLLAIHEIGEKWPQQLYIHLFGNQTRKIYKSKDWCDLLQNKLIQHYWNAFIVNHYLNNMLTTRYRSLVLNSAMQCLLSYNYSSVMALLGCISVLFSFKCDLISQKASIMAWLLCNRNPLLAVDYLIMMFNTLFQYVIYTRITSCIWNTSIYPFVYPIFQCLWLLSWFPW